MMPVMIAPIDPRARGEDAEQDHEQPQRQADRDAVLQRLLQRVERDAGGVVQVRG
jgi:hypothetical protein